MEVNVVGVLKQGEEDSSVSMFLGESDKGASNQGENSSRILRSLDRKTITEIVTKLPVSASNPVLPLIELLELQPAKPSSLAPPKFLPFTKPLKEFYTEFVGPETHAAYAFTWFSLSIFGALATRRMFFPKARVGSSGSRRSR
jgi:cytochrome oxidase assembly protein ShyY1